MKRFALPLVVISRIAAADPPTPEPLDEDVALELSIAGAALPLGVLFGGAIAYNHGAIGEPTWVLIGAAGLSSAIVLPSIGHVYARDLFSTGLEIRVAGVIAGAGLVAISSSDVAKNGWFYAGVTVVFAGIGWDLATARSAVRDFNVEHHLVVAPMPVPSGGAGLAIAGTF